MLVEIVPLPSMLEPRHLAGRSVIVIDTLRASTTIAAALAAGAAEVQVFETIEQARSAAAAFGGSALLAGERGCRRIEGFDLGNSPREMTPEAVAGRPILMTTTNGTRAILAAGGAGEVVVGSFANRSATAGHLLKGGRDVTCVCAGTEGRRAPEDELAAEAFRSALISGPPFQEMAFEPLRKAMLETEGGRNIVAAGLREDVEFAAHADRLDVVCKLTRQLNNVVRRIA